MKEVRNLDLESKDSSELSAAEIDEMRSVFFKNRAEFDIDFARMRVEEEFDPVMKESGHKFYMLKKGGRVLSFCRFDNLPNGNLYAGFVNTQTSVRGMSIGGVFFEKAIEQEARGRAVELTVRTENPAHRLYERMGFKIEKTYINPKSQKEYYKMIKPGE